MAIDPKLARLFAQLAPTVLPLVTAAIPGQADDALAAAATPALLNSADDVAAAAPALLNSADDIAAAAAPAADALPFVGVRPTPKHDIFENTTEIEDEWGDLLDYETVGGTIDGKTYNLPELDILEDRFGPDSQTFNNAQTKYDLIQSYLNNWHTYDSPVTPRSRIGIPNALQNGITTIPQYDKIKNTPYLKKLYEQLHNVTNWDDVNPEIKDLPF